MIIARGAEAAIQGKKAKTENNCRRKNMHRYNVSDLLTNEDASVLAESAPKAIAKYFAQCGIEEKPVKVHKADRTYGRFSVSRTAAADDVISGDDTASFRLRYRWYVFNRRGYGYDYCSNQEYRLHKEKTK